MGLEWQNKIRNENFILKNLELVHRRFAGSKEGLSLLALLVLSACSSGGGGSAPVPGSREINGTDGSDHISEAAATGDLTVDSKGGDDQVTTGSGNDQIDAGSGNDQIQSGSGNDQIFAGAGRDTVDAGAGDDLLVVVGTTEAQQFTTTNVIDSAGQTIDLSSLLSLTDLNGHSQSDLVSGEIIDGGTGNDRLVALGKVDFSGVKISNIAELILDTDATLESSHLASNGGSIQTIHGNGQTVLRIADSTTGLVDVTLDSLTVQGISEIRIGQGVTLIVADAASLTGAGIQTLFGAGSLQVTSNMSADAFAGLIIDDSLTVLDADGNQVADPFGATLKAINDAPTDIQLDQATALENSAGSVIGQLTVDDPDNSDHPFGQHVLTVDDNRFEITSDGTLKLKDGQSLDYEADSSLPLTVTATDDSGNGLSLDKQFTLTVQDINEAPTAISLSSTAIAENSTGGAVGQLAVADPDGTGSGFATYTYTLTQYQADGVTPESDPANILFEVDAQGQLQLKSGIALDYETLQTVALQVEATNTADPTHSIASDFTITVNDLNEAPSAPVLDSNFISDNADTGSNITIGSLSATDPDAGDIISFSVTGGADAEKFVVVGDELQFKSGQTIDRDVQDTYQLEVSATDSGGRASATTLQIEVSAIRLSSNNLDENLDTSGGATVVGALTAPGLDGAATYSIIGGADQALFSLVGDSLQLNQGVVLDHESQNHLTVTIEATDGIETAQTTFSVEVADINEAPVSIALDNATVDENQPAGIIGQLTTSDPDAAGEAFGSHVYSVDDARFEITGDGTLKLAAGQMLDFETEPTISLQVTATDDGGNGLSVTQDFTVTVNDQNEAPSTIALDDLQVVEGTSGAAVGQVSVTDADSSATPFGQFAYQLSDDRFEVSSTGVLKLKFGQILDFETEASIPLTVTATDDNGNGFAVNQDFTLEVTNRNEAPTGVSYAGRDYVTTNEAADTLLGRLATVDPDAADTHSYQVLSVRDNLGAALTIHPFDISAEGHLVIAADATPEQLSAISGHEQIIVRAEAVDSGGLGLSFETTYNVLEEIRGQDAADDSLMGTAQAEQLVGLGGNDQLDAQAGDDILVGGADDDTLIGGEGADTFVYQFDSSTTPAWSGRDGLDSITDFSLLQGDKLQFVDTAGLVGDVQDFKDGYDAGLYSAFMTDADSLTVKFANNDQGSGFVSGQHQIDIDFDAAVDAALYDSGTGHFNSADAFVQALGGDASLIFG
jgi:Ca2+-binding RTX toxin-like protein